MQGKDGQLSLQTLIVASLSSAAAALVTSWFWESGTVFSAAFTPVIVSIASEALKRPAKGISQVRAARRGRSSSTAGAPVVASQGETTVMDEAAVTEGRGRRGGGRGFVRVFGRRVNMRLALATGGLAFLIAAFFLTVPELVTGESVAGQPGRTTLGGGSSVDTTGEESDEEGASGEDSQSTEESQDQGSDAQDTQSEPESRPDGTQKDTAPETQQQQEGQRRVAPDEGPSGAGGGSTPPSPSSPQPQREAPTPTPPGGE